MPPRERISSTLNLNHPVVAPAAPAPAPAAPKRQRFNYYADVDQERRLRAAYAAVSGATGPYASYNDFKITALLALAARYEAELNDGQPFPEAPERFAPGRPLNQL